jgi:hypothetical protein
MEDNGGFIAVNKNLIASIGLNEAIVFCELVSKYNYYEKENMLNDGYMYCTYDDLKISTGLSQTAQTNAIKNLEKLNLIKCVITGFPKKRYITVLDAELSKYLQQGKEKIEQLKKKIRHYQYIDINNMDINTMENNNIDNNISVYTNQYDSISKSINSDIDINTQYIENDMQYIDINMPLYTNQYRIINNNNKNINNNNEIIKEYNNNINNKLINNISYNRENDNNDTRKENNFINSLLAVEEENNDYHYLVVNNKISTLSKDMIINYYLEQYKIAYKKIHSKINNQNVYSKIDDLSSRYGINSEMWIELIDYHFSSSNLETDGNIHHFLSDNIIKNYLSKINKLNNFSVVDNKENNLEYAHIDNNIKEIIQYFIDKYYSCFGRNYWEKEDFYVSDIRKYAEMIELLSSDFGIEATLYCWRKNIDVFFELQEYGKTLNTFLQHDVINNIVAERMTNNQYKDVYIEEYENDDLPF